MSFAIPTSVVSSFWTIVVNLVFLWIPPVDVFHLVCRLEDLGESSKSLTAVGVGSGVTFWERSFWDYKDDSSVCHYPGGRNVYIRREKRDKVCTSVHMSMMIASHTMSFRDLQKGDKVCASRLEYFLRNIVTNSRVTPSWREIVSLTIL
nr:hypothetical protein [Tanacetum cinerariifolium]